MPTLIYELSGGAALDTIQTINSAASVSASAWGSTIATTFTNSNQVLTLPTILTADIGKSITVQNAGEFAFTIAIATGVITSAIGLVIAPSSTLTIKAISTTSAIVTSTNAAQIVAAESGEAYFPLANTGISANSIIMSFTLPSAGVWDVEAQVATNYNTLGSGHLYFRNSLGIEVPYSRVYLQGGTQGAQSIITTVRAKITTTAAETCQLFSTAAIAAVYGYNTATPAQGGTKISWDKATGQAASNGISGATAGDRKFSDRLLDHGNWILLNGRARNTLTPEQQSVAIALGYGTNIPDLRGRMPLGASATFPMLTTGGSLTIAQNQLPNLSFTPTISSTFNVYNGSGTPAWDTAPTSGITNFALTQSTPEQVNINLQSAGILGITSSSISINGNVTQQNYIPSYATGNWFVWLGSNTNTFTLASPMVGANGTSAGAGGIVPTPTATDNTKFLRGDATWQTLSGASSSLTKTLTYGAALLARQPVYMQADGKVYPMVGSGGSLTGGALTPVFFSASVENFSIALVPTFPNRFITTVNYSDGTCYSYVADVNSTTGAITQTQTNFTGGTAATNNEGQSLCLNSTATKAILAYQGSSGLQIDNFSCNSSGLVARLGTATTGGISASPVVLATSNVNKFLCFKRGGATHDLVLIDGTAATPIISTLTNYPLNNSSVKSGFIASLFLADNYVFFVTNGTQATIQAFSFNTSTNAINLIGAQATIAGFTGALNYAVLYSDPTETWLAVQRDSNSNQLTIVKILNATGVITSFAPVTYTADSIANGLAVQILGYRRSVGKFLIAWNTTAAPNQVKFGEWVLDRATGLISVSIPAVFGVNTGSNWNQGRGFGHSVIGLGYVYRVFNTSLNLQASTFGTYTTAAGPYSLIGINQTAGAINTTGTVDLLGSIQAGYTGLTPGSIYYADLATGGITLTPVSGIIVGRAVSTTEIQINNS